MDWKQARVGWEQLSDRCIWFILFGRDAIVYCLDQHLVIRVDFLSPAEKYCVCCDFLRIMCSVVYVMS